MSATLPNQVWPPLSRPDLGEVKGWAYPCAVTDGAVGLRAWFRDASGPGWCPAHDHRKYLIYAAWAVHERKRADAERRLRKAREVLWNTDPESPSEKSDAAAGLACAESESAIMALRALGVDP